MGLSSAHHAAAAAAAASSLQFFYQGGDPLGQPPPAHMGIPPYQLDPKTAGAMGKSSLLFSNPNIQLIFQVVQLCRIGWKKESLKSVDGWPFCDGNSIGQLDD